MHSRMSWEDLWPLLVDGTLDTLYMVGLAGLFIVLNGLPLGVLLFLSRRHGLMPMPRVNAVLGTIINTGRSLPFIVLLIALIPFTRLLVGTTLGSTAAIVPITIGAFPFFARLTESALDEVDYGRIEAVLSMGGNVWHIITKALLPEALPSLLAATTHAPIMSTLMVCEMTGEYRLLPGLLIACVLASVLSRTLRHDSIYRQHAAEH